MEEPKCLVSKLVNENFDIICLENDKSTNFDVKNIAKCSDKPGSNIWISPVSLNKGLVLLN